MIDVQMTAGGDELLTIDAIRAALEKGLGGGKFAGAKLLILIPDHTRSIPLPLLFRQLVRILHDARQIDFMVALGTHPPLSNEALNQLVGISANERTTHYQHVGLFNHIWDRDDILRQIGVLTQEEIKEIAGEAWHSTLGGDVPVRINRMIFEYDHLLILGPTFPHEVVGFSGGAKYLFPGISGSEMINVTHWLGALMTILKIIGVRDTPVRTMIHRAAEFVTIPITLIALTVMGHERLAGVFIGDHISAWQAAADFSAQKHITRLDQHVDRVLAVTPHMYDELWTAGKAMYKTEPVVRDGGEVIIYAPHLAKVSDVHGKFIYEIGYHPLDYFLKQWDRFKHVPLGVLAHSTHVRGGGVFENGVEKPRIQVTLASRISQEDCERLSLGYLDPKTVNLSALQNREGVLYVPEAGERLYRLTGF